MSSTKDAKALAEWHALKKRVRKATALPVSEPLAVKNKRIKHLLANPLEFFQYYFPHYCKSPFGYFHREAVLQTVNDPNIYIVCEWPREHAKSVVMGTMTPLLLYFKGEINCAVYVSQTETKAAKLLSEIQAELEDNQRLINDFGPQKGFGDWADGSFRTSSGVGFYAFGLGQSVRGLKDGEDRPDICIVDDIDKNQLCKNPQLVQEAVDWLQTDVFGACSIKQSRFIVLGNRIAKNSILANLVGDVEPADPKKEGIVHSKVYAFQDSSRQKSDHILGRPAWVENYSAEHLLRRFRLLGYTATRREFFHEHIEKGNIFKHEHIQFGQMLPLNRYEQLVTYCDPSYKDARKNDFKAVVFLGKVGNQIHILDCWVRQASVSSMVAWHWRKAYDLHKAGVNCKHFVEANFMQDRHMNEYTAFSESAGWPMHIKGDKRSKPDKVGRIEALEPLFEQGLFIFNEAHRQSNDMQALISQFLNFPTGHDDGPDAVEGGAWHLRKNGATNKRETIRGQYIKSNERSV